MEEIIHWKCPLCHTGQWERKRPDSEYRCSECENYTKNPRINGVEILPPVTTGGYF